MYVEMRRSRVTYDSDVSDPCDLGVNARPEEDWAATEGYALLPCAQRPLLTKWLVQLGMDSCEVELKQSTMYDESGTWFAEQSISQRSKALGETLDNACTPFDDEVWFYTCKLVPQMPVDGKVVAKLVVTHYHDVF